MVVSAVRKVDRPPCRLYVVVSDYENDPCIHCQCGEFWLYSITMGCFYYVIGLEVCCIVDSVDNTGQDDGNPSVMGSEMHEKSVGDHVHWDFGHFGHILVH